jgi:hypothetical protein
MVADRIATGIDSPKASAPSSSNAAVLGAFDTSQDRLVQDVLHILDLNSDGSISIAEYILCLLALVGTATVCSCLVHGRKRDPHRVDAQQLMKAREGKDLVGLEGLVAEGALVGQGAGAQSMLYFAIVAGLSETVVEWIISRKADVNWVQEGTKDTALHLAVRSTSDHTKLLVRAGASVSARNAKQQAPLQQERTEATHLSVLDASRERSLMSVICPVCAKKSYSGVTCLACGENCRLLGRYALEKQIGEGGFGSLLLGRDYGFPSQPQRVLKRCVPKDPRTRRYACMKRL